MVHAKNAGSGCCNCPGDCEIFTDNFDRADSTNLGAGWVEDTGDWEIVSNELKANAVGSVYTTASLGHRQRNVGVKARNAQPGKIYRLSIAVDDSGNITASMELAVGSTTAVISLLAGGGTIDSYEFVYEPGADYSLFACVNEGGTYGGVAEITWAIWDCQTFEGEHAGIENMGDDAEYDDFYFFEHSLDSDNPLLNCRPCTCECDGKCFPRVLTLTLESSCGHRDGLTCTLNLNTSFYPAFVWDGEEEWPNPLSPGSSQTYHFRLYCKGSAAVVIDECSEDDFALCAPEYMGGCATDDWKQDLDGTCGIFGVTGRCTDIVICDPIELRFGPGFCGGSPPPDPPPECTETIVITA